MEDILALDADVVIHCAQAFGQSEQMLEDVIALLESGKNVITVSDYIAPQIHGPAVRQRLDAAADAAARASTAPASIPAFCAIVCRQR